MSAVTTRDGDRLLGFTIAGRHARGRVVRLDAALDRILSAHAYPEQIAHLLADALVLTALLGALLRPEDGQLTMQAKGEGGPVRLLVTDFRDGMIRGYAAQDLDRRFPPAATLDTLFGNKGQLVVTLDQTASQERYQGIVALEGESLQQAAEAYFANSEQLPTLVRIAAAQGPDGRWTAGGLLLQQMARAEEGDTRLHVQDVSQDWRHIATLGGSITADELTDPALPLETLLWRLFHEEGVRVLPAQPLARGCRCSEDHIRRVLSQFPEEERAEMRNAEGVIAVDCEFCARQFLMQI